MLEIFLIALCWTGVTCVINLACRKIFGVPEDDVEENDYNEYDCDSKIIVIVVPQEITIHVSEDDKNEN